MPRFRLLVSKAQLPRRTQEVLANQTNEAMEKSGARVFLLTLVLSIALVSSMPHPGGGHGHEHTHFIIHVPELIHKHHHTHVKNIHITKPEEDSGHEHIEEW